MVPHVLAALGPHPRPGQRRARRSTLRPRGRASTVQPRPHLRRAPASRSTTGARTLDGVARARPAPRAAPTRSPSRPGTPLAADPARHPDDDDQADKYLLADERARRRRAATGTRSRTGPGPATSAATTSSTGRQGDYLGVRLRGPLATATAAGGGTCARPSATSTPSTRATAEAAATSLDADEPRIEGLQLSLRTCAGASRPSALPDATGELDGLVEPRRRPGSSSPVGAPAGQRGRPAPALSGSQAAGTGGRANTWPAKTRSGSPGTTSTARLASISRSR